MQMLPSATKATPTSCVQGGGAGGRGGEGGALRLMILSIVIAMLALFASELLARRVRARLQG